MLSLTSVLWDKTAIYTCSGSFAYLASSAQADLELTALDKDSLHANTIEVQQVLLYNYSKYIIILTQVKQS